MNRLPFFLQSEYYSEYRLAKLMLQQGPNYCFQRRRVTSNQTCVSAQQQHFHPQINLRNDNALKAPTCPHCQAAVRSAGDTAYGSPEQELCNTKSCSESESLCRISSQSSFSLTFMETKDPCSSKTDFSRFITAPSAGISEAQHHHEPNSLTFDSSKQQVELMAAEVVQQVLNNALNVMTRHTSIGCSCESKVSQLLPREGKERLEGEEEKFQERKTECGEEDKTNEPKMKEVGNWGATHENVLGICCHGPCCYGTRPGLDEFKEFLQGTPGEKLLNLWMDIERLKTTQNRERKKRYVVLMRSCYLLSSSQSSLNVELLSRLGLSTSPCWTEDKLCSVQPFLMESLLSYWFPRFWTSQRVHKDQEEVLHPRQWTEPCLSPLSDIQPHPGFLTLPLLGPDSPAVHTQLYSSRRVEEMLQALCVEPWAGLYFTNFCEQSGNQLWENAVNFWTDLQHYRELFYQDGLDLYRVQRQAQLLYSTYLFSSARSSFGVNEEIRREVYSRMIPAYEELFDRVEEHTLNLLLEPWTLLVSRDTQSFQKVCLQEEVRCVDSPEYRELQSLYKESKRQLYQMEQCGSVLSPSAFPSTPLSKGSGTSDAWSSVSPNYRGYRLGSLLRHRHEIGHFMSFLQSQNASIHMQCWLDLEQYKRTPQRDKAVRKERSTHITTKYLNWEYFFGPESPAAIEQQNDILRLAGGHERLKQECLSNSVAVEVQDIIRSHIEKKWLPLFLSTAEFTERQKHQPKPQAADRLSVNPYRRRRARRAAWKAEGLWMSSSKEILLFRQILLNPATCLQFQHFVFLKGDFLENDLLFWLEVQRYKDLCHSHSEEATIQQKISTIISCFIDSSMPPALQIDIPPEQAQHILEKRHELGPYIFREAQMSVFSELLKYWPEFQELCSCVQQEQLLPLLEEKRVSHRARVRRLRRKEEEEEEEIQRRRRRAQKKLERPESNLQEEDETDDEEEVTEEEELSSERTPTQWLSWSYSKYMAALKREEVRLKRQSEREASFSTVSETSSHCSIRSGGRKHSSQRPLCWSSGRTSKQSNRSVMACNIK
ncbi:regulator of G-protein signaling 22 isoform X1 [Xyrichtys novacula]|uniref:Regulator of G-protein signaling 22 isoform X1 n=2 Tax=Xyrichtys novacula TaxID=13765 RepID=A0AAV1FLG9_XYRNO|nr:regulator of G-protein signaling 22 isoform X1 [Xyrichtys novacula]